MQKYGFIMRFTIDGIYYFAIYDLLFTIYYLPYIYVTLDL